MGVDRVLIAIMIIAPDLVKQLRPAVYMLGVSGEMVQ